MTTAGLLAYDRYLTEHEDAHLAGLLDLLRIPSVSALPDHRSDIERAATWVADCLRAAGVPEVRLLETGGNPLVYGHWHVADDQPTALIYAHYDVQPPDPLDLWVTPPFEPTIRDGRLYARGAADDKAGVAIVITAIEALARTAGAPPVNLKFFFEGEEEIGSPSLPAFVRDQKDLLACDYVISADGAMFGPETPSVEISTKGIAACQIDLRTAKVDLHSGMYGASVPNAAQAIARLVATLHDADGRVAIEGFYDRVREFTPEERAEIAAVPFDEATYRGGLDLSALWGDPDFTPNERNWIRPTVDVNGIWGGFQGAGTKTVTPSEAHAKLTCRLVPDQDPEEILDLIERHVTRYAPIGAQVSIHRFAGSARPFEIRRDNPALIIAGQVLHEIFGKEPLVVRNGGTLPVAETFQRELDADMVFFAWSQPDCQAHAPNEWFRLEDFRRGRRAYCALLLALAR